MAVLIEGLSVVILCNSIVTKFLGGSDKFITSVPNSTLCSDGELACVSFMTPIDVQKYINFLSQNNLVHKLDNKAVDIVVVDQIEGPLTLSDWLGFGETDWNNNPEQIISVCYAKQTKVEKVVVPKGWVYEKSLSKNYKYVNEDKIPNNLKFIRHENGIDILIDVESGQEFYIKRS